GKGLSRGYLNRPELTAARFIDHPFEVAAKLYRTGDMARWLPDGTLEFLGRQDDQVKIRGFRIELGELEATILKYDGVDQCVALAQEGTDGNRQLVAYVVLKNNGNSTALKQFLATQLPHYMIPAKILELATIPLTANGKVDKRALPLVDFSETLTEVFVAPRNEMESLLTDVWQQLLGVKRVGVYDNFYELGGDSIKAIQVAARMHRLGFDLEVKAIFQFQNIAAIAHHLQQIKRIPDQSVICGPVPLNAIQRAFFSWDLNAVHHFNQAVLLYCPAQITAAQLRDFLRTIQAHHDMLRATFTREADEVGQVVADLSHPLPFQSIDLRTATQPTEAMEDWANKIQAHLDLTQNAWQAVHFQLPDSDRLLLVLHHLIVDGISWRILLEDLSTLYDQSLEGSPLNLYLKTDAYRTWTQTLTDYAQSEALLVEKAYWQKIIKGPVDRLPLNRQSVDLLAGAEQTISFTLDPERTEQLVGKIHQRFDTEITDVLLTALGMAFYECFQVTNQLISLEGHGREEVFEALDIKRTLGWFTTVFPARLHHEVDLSIGAQVQKVKKQLRAIPNKGLGYGILKYLTNALKTDQHPQLSFNYLGQFDQDFEQNGFKLAPESTGIANSPANQRIYDLEVGGLIEKQQLRMGITFHPQQFETRTIQQLAKAYQKALERCIEYCLATETIEPDGKHFTSPHIPKDNLEKLKELFG
ncbi:MAG: condensation domain-containing protein, partial [Bacteroidota bacterium]